MKNLIDVFYKDDDKFSELEIIEQCNKCLQKFSEAFDNENLVEMDAQLHFPHILISGNEYIHWVSPGQVPLDFFDSLRKTGWEKTICTLSEPILICENKAHYKWNYSRLDGAGNVISHHSNIWILLKKEGRWGIALRSY